MEPQDDQSELEDFNNYLGYVSSVLGQISGLQIIMPKNYLTAYYIFHSDATVYYNYLLIVIHDYDF